MIINLHGLNSSGNNSAYQYLQNWSDKAVKIISPSYTVHNFDQGIQEIENAINLATIEEKTEETLLFIGSSTGALYAEYLAEKTQGAIVFINPVVDPEQLRPAIGQNKNFNTGQKYLISKADIDSFPNNSEPLNSLARQIYIEIDDTILDHQLTIEKYQNIAEIKQYPGDHHRFSYWPEILPQIEQFYSNLK